MKTDRDRIQYRLTPVSDLQPGDQVVSFHQDGSLASRLTVDSVAPGEAYIGSETSSSHVTGYHITYVERDDYDRQRFSVAGTESKSAVVIDEPTLSTPAGTAKIGDVVTTSHGTVGRIYLIDDNIKHGYAGYEAVILRSGPGQPAGIDPHTGEPYRMFGYAHEIVRIRQN